MITLNATHQQTKRLVDAVNGTYQTVLTINSSLDQSDIVGTYSCTVRNIKGESSEAVVVPGETCIHCTSHTVHTNVADVLHAFPSKQSTSGVFLTF